MKPKKSLGWIPLVEILVLVPITVYLVLVISELVHIPDDFIGWVGLVNYLRMFWEVETFPDALVSTVELGVVILMPVAIVLLVLKKLFLDKNTTRLKNMVFYIVLEVSVSVLMWLISKIHASLALFGCIRFTYEINPMIAILSLEFGTLIVLIVWIIDYILTKIQIKKENRLLIKNESC